MIIKGPLAKQFGNRNRLIYHTMPVHDTIYPMSGEGFIDNATHTISDIKDKIVNSELIQHIWQFAQTPQGQMIIKTGGDIVAYYIKHKISGNGLNHMGDGLNYMRGNGFTPFMGDGLNYMGQYQKKKRKF